MSIPLVKSVDKNYNRRVCFDQDTGDKEFIKKRVFFNLKLYRHVLSFQLCNVIDSEGNL